MMAAECCAIAGGFEACDYVADDPNGNGAVTECCVAPQGPCTADTDCCDGSETDTFACGPAGSAQEGLCCKPDGQACTVTADGPDPDCCSGNCNKQGNSYFCGL